MPRAFLTILALTLAIVASGGVNTLAQQDLSSHPWIGEDAPTFTLPRVAGGELSLADLKGKFVVVHFGTSW